MREIQRSDMMVIGGVGEGEKGAGKIWWSGGAVKRWSGDAVERWSGGAVERWNGGTVERWSGGAVERPWNARAAVITSAARDLALLRFSRHPASGILYLLSLIRIHRSIFAASDASVSVPSLSTS